MRRTALVIGAGSYVLGDSFGHGVVLPSLLDCVGRGSLDRILLAVRTPRSPAFWERVARLRRELGTTVLVEERIVTDPGALASLDLDSMVAFLCIPDAVHAAYAEALLRRRVPTWVVKPLSGCGATSERLDALARSTETPLFVDYHKRFDPSFRKLGALVSSGTLGDLLLYSVQYTQPWKLPLGDLAAWSGDLDVFQYIGCHFVDLLLSLVPSLRPLRVSATGIPGRLAQASGPRFDLVHALMDLGSASASGRRLRADFQVGWSDPLGTPAKSHQRVELFFERGRVLVDQKERGFQVWNDEGFEEANPHFLQLLPDPSSGATRVEGYGPESIRRFLEVRERPELIHQDGLPWSRSAKRTDAILDGVRRSLRADGRWIECGPDALPCPSVPVPEEALQRDL